MTIHASPDLTQEGKDSGMNDGPGSGLHPAYAMHRLEKKKRKKGTE